MRPTARGRVVAWLLVLAIGLLIGWVTRDLSLVTYSTFN